MNPNDPRVLMQMGMGFAPLASGIQPSYRTGFEGVPFFSQNPLLSMIAQPLLSGLMGQQGMAPMGLHSQNVWDTMRHQQFMRMQQEAMSAAAGADRENYMRTFRGVAAMTGQPWGGAQRQAAGSIADAMQFMTPMMAMMAPDLLDQLGGARGSATVLAQRSALAGRYRVDPVTGQMGWSQETHRFMGRELQRDLFDRLDPKQMHGISAGQAGLMFNELQSRGLVGGRGTDLRREDIDKLSLDPAVADRMRSLDVERIKRSIKSYSSAIAAMRDIFGDMGRPNAPMAELFQGLEALTMGMTHQMDPARLSQMVRQTYNLSQATGTPIQNLMVMQQHAASRAQQLGLNPIFGLQATQGGMGFGGAARGLGLTATPAWGVMSADQLQQADINLRLAASGSNMANRIGTALRISQTAGGFAAGSSAAEFVSAVQAGQTTFRDANGRQRSINLSDEEFVRMISGAQGSRGQRLGVTDSDVRQMLRERSVNQEQIASSGAQDLVRRAMLREDVQPFIANQAMSTTLLGRLRGAGVDERSARAAAGAVSGRAMERIMGLSAQEMGNNDLRTDRIAGILQEEMAGTAAGAAIGRMGADERQAFYRMTAERFFGRANEVLAGSGQFRAMGNFVNVHRLMNDAALRQGDKTKLQAAMEGRLQEALTPLGQGSALRRAMDYLQRARPDEANIPGLIADAFGGVRTEDINKAIAKPLQELSAQQKAAQEMHKRILQEPDPAKRAELQKQLTKMEQDITRQASDISRTAQNMGLYESGVTGRDIDRAVSSGAAADRAMRDVIGIRGNIDIVSDDLVKAQVGKKVSFDKDTIGQARAVAIVRLRQEAQNISDPRARQLALMRLESDEGRALVEAETRALVEGRDTKIRSEAEAKAFIRAKRAMMPVRAMPIQIEEGMKVHGLSREEAIEFAELKNQARRVGIDISDLGKGRQALEGLREKFKMAEDLMLDEETSTTMADRHKRAGFFLASDQGKEFRRDIMKQRSDVEGITAGLGEAAPTARRYGTIGGVWHKELREIQKRQAVLAFQYAGGDFTKLALMDLNIDTTTEEGRKKFRSVRDEMEKLKLQERGILGQIEKSKGKTGAQFAGTDQEEIERLMGKDFAAKSPQEHKQMLEDIAFLRKGGDIKTLDKAGQDRVGALIKRQEEFITKTRGEVTMTPKDTAERLQRAYGLDAQKDIDRIAAKIGSGAQRDVVEHLAKTQEQLRRFAGRGQGLGTMKDLDAMLTEYGAIEGMQGDAKGKALKEFTAKYGIGDIERFQSAREFQRKAGFLKYGSGRADEADFDKVFKTMQDAALKAPGSKEPQKMDVHITGGNITIGADGKAAINVAGDGTQQSVVPSGG